jgi:hypothetical protein
MREKCSNKTVYIQAHCLFGIKAEHPLLQSFLFGRGTGWGSWGGRAGAGGGEGDGAEGVVKPGPR